MAPRNISANINVITVSPVPFRRRLERETWRQRARVRREKHPVKQGRAMMGMSNLMRRRWAKLSVVGWSLGFVFGAPAIAQDDASALLDAGIQSYRQGELDAAKEAFENALSQEPVERRDRTLGRQRLDPKGRRDGSRKRPGSRRVCEGDSRRCSHVQPRVFERRGGDFEHRQRGTRGGRRRTVRRDDPRESRVRSQSRSCVDSRPR